ncbi:MAG: STAS-like domain-containing protein [Candidatus Pacebacteria bacterium]|nr:STAS-like domain-containing protein [Candidatus Paceibacterota bacterium]
MKIELKKFGTTLISRQTGKEAYSAFLPTLKSLPSKEELVIDFSGVNTFSPAWGDEFLTKIIKDYKNQVKLVNTKNLSVKNTLSFLEDINKIKFKIES